MVKKYGVFMDGIYLKYYLKLIVLIFILLLEFFFLFLFILNKFYDGNASKLNEMEIIRDFDFINQ